MLHWQSMMESQGDVEDSAVYDNVDYSGDDQVDELAGFDAGGVGEYTAEAMANNFNSQDLYGPEGEVVLDGRGFYPSMLVCLPTVFMLCRSLRVSCYEFPQNGDQNNNLLTQSFARFARDTRSTSRMFIRRKRWRWDINYFCFHG